MAVTLATTAAPRLSLGFNGTGDGVCGYNGQPYDAIDNPGGMDGNGVAVNWINMCADMVALGLSTAQKAEMVSNLLLGSNGWGSVDGATIYRLSDTQFTISVTASPQDLTSTFKARRALSLVQTASGYGYVSSSSYNAETGLTTVTVSGVVLDSGLSEIWFGQDPDNAPQAVVETTFPHLDFRVTSGCTLIAGGRYRAYLSASQTFSLPENPSSGDTVEIWDCARTFNAYPAVIAGSVRGDSGGVTLDLISRTIFSYDAIAATWSMTFVVED
jgi:hypothetical protein